MADISHSELLQSLGSNVAGFTKSLANEAANKVCEIYKAYPWALTFGDWGRYKEGFWDEMCAVRPSGLPVPPKSNFTGGQCAADYSVNIFYTYAPNPYATTGKNGNVARVWGPVLSISSPISDPPEGSIFGRRHDVVIVCHGSSSEPYSSAVKTIVLPRYGDWQSLDSAELVRQDGQPDNCGNPPAEYPKTPVPSTVLNTTINVTSNSSSYNVPIIIHYPPANNYNLEIDADDIRLTFDFGGVTFSSNPLYNRINKSYDQSLDLGDEVTNLAQNFNSFTNNSNNLSLSWNLGAFQTTSALGSSAKGDDKKQSNLAYVTLDLTQVPVNAKTQEGEKAQDILYAGWFQFVAEGYYYPREPVHFRKSIFRAPAGATSYSYTLYKGFQANVTEHRT